MKIWIVVADEREALSYEVAADRARQLVAGRDGARPAADGGCKLTLKLSNPHALPDRELEADRPGRAFSSSTGQRHGIDGERSMRRTDQQDFAKRVTDAIERGRHAGNFDRVVLAAGPRMLGMLRAGLSDATRNSVAAEVAKDLVRFEGRALMDHLPPEAKPKSFLRI
jgi:protein required for attachment to host cells